MPMRRGQMKEWAERIKGKMVFSLNIRSAPITIGNIDYNTYYGRIDTVYMNKVGNRNMITMYTDKGRTQNLDSNLEVSSDGNMLIDCKEGFSGWAVILNDNEIFKLKSCNLCLSKCKSNTGPCDLFDSILVIYTQGVKLK